MMGKTELLEKGEWHSQFYLGIIGGVRNIQPFYCAL